MTSPFAAINAIFNRPRGAAAVLFLIEDSCYMDPLWQRLRDSYLPSLLNAIKDANPSAVVSSLAPALSFTDRYRQGRGVVDDHFGTRPV